MRILSFQGKRVWDMYLSKGITYHADWGVAREQVSLDDLTEDIVQLSGECPIWGYTQPYFNYTNMWDGSMIEKIRCEMSLDQDDAFKGMYLLELEVPNGEVFVGKYHNDNKFVVVFDRIEKSWVKAVYTVEDCKKGNAMEQWYYKTITNVFTNTTINGKLDVLTISKVDMWELSLEDDWNERHHPPYSTSISYESRCIGCGKKTKVWYKGKPVCSLSCLTKVKLKFGIAGIEFRTDGEKIFDKITEEEFRNNSVRDLVCLHSNDSDIDRIEFKDWICTDGKHYEWRK